MCNRTPKFALEGISSVNKGAELMMYAILQEIERKYPNAIVYVPVDSIKQGIGYIHTSLDVRYKPIQIIRDWCVKNHLIGICRRLHIPCNSLFEDKYYVRNTKYLIDGSGFHYSDVWNHSNTVMETRRILLKTHKHHGAKIIMMPQAFGPLETESIKQGLLEVNKYADLVIVRDDVSMQYINKCEVLSPAKIRQYTDYTSLVEPIVPAGYARLENGICIIPNGRLFDKGNYTFEGYLTFVRGVVNLAKKHHKIPYLLNHEGAIDTEIARKIIANIEEPIEFVDNLNALEVKGMISTAYLVISSRFHGLASSLNTGVPCLATGWSHKYAELFHDYEIDDAILDISDYENSLNRVKHLLNESVNNVYRNQLSVKVPQIKDKVKTMWGEIWSV